MLVDVPVKVYVPKYRTHEEDKLWFEFVTIAFRQRSTVTATGGYLLGCSGWQSRGTMSYLRSRRLQKRQLHYSGGSLGLDSTDAKDSGRLLRHDALLYEENVHELPTPLVTSPPPPYEMHYAQQPHGQRPLDPVYQNSCASQSFLAPFPAQYQQSYGSYGAQPWTSHSALDLPSRQDTHRRNAGWQADNSRPIRPARPDPRSKGRNDCVIARGMNQGAALYDNMRSRLGDIWGELDEENAERPEDIDLAELEELTRRISLEEERGTRAIAEVQRSAHRKPEDASRNRSKPTLINYKKTWLYANSRLPPYQPPFKAYLETWRVICQAVRASAQVYQRPRSGQREHFVDADWRNGTKAMALKSTPIDESNLIVFAIRGSQKNFMDWAVNFRPAPTSPEGILDDEGNACHAGFLAVARAMIAPVAARLRQLLEQDPSRCNSSLLITGHSAGGAVASLLYSHMLSTRVQSELNTLTGFFKRVHCITFGAPPVSFLPLQKPSHMHRDKSLFLSFANEGDLVVRADKTYLFSLMRLIAAPGVSTAPNTVHTLAKKVSMATTRSGKPQRSPAPYWSVPPATLSTPGRMVLLRDRPGTERHPAIEAISTTDEQLRDVVFGDPTMHVMALYRQRIEKLAFAAMMGDEAI